MNAKTEKPKILLVDDEPNILFSYGRGLRRDWDLVTAASGEEGLQAVREKGPFAVIVADFNMPRMNGITFLTQALELAPESVRIMLTGEGDFHIATRAVNEGSIFRFMTKPCPLENLEKALKAGHQQYRLLQIEKEARQQEIIIAGEIQQALLLEKVPQKIDDMQIAAVSVASLGVDGDFIDFFQLSDSCVDVIVGDVMGKGVHAALVGAGARNQLGRIMWRLFRDNGTDPEPETIMQMLTSDLEDQLGQLCRFITMVYARIDSAKRTFSFVDAGHMPTIWYQKATDTWIDLKGKNMPVGMPLLRAMQQTTVEFTPGDFFLLYSDGLFEGRNATGEMFGDRLLMKCLEKNKELTAAAMLTNLVDEFKAFVGRDSFDDDLTIVMLQSRQSN